MRHLFGPAIRLLNRLSLANKLLVIALVMLVPVLVADAMLLQRIQADIDFSERETLAVPMVEPARQFMQSAQGHRGAAQQIIAGNAAFRARLADFAAKADAAMKAGDEANARLGATLGTTSDWEKLKAQWKAVTEKATEVPAKESFLAHTQLIESMRGFILKVADQSNATLDPAMDTYYLMDIFAMRMPGVVEDLGQLRAISTRVVVRQKATEDERIELASLIKFVDRDRASLTNAVLKAIEGDATLKGVVETPGAAFDSATRPVLERIRGDILGATGEIKLAPADTFDAATKAVDAGYALLDTAMHTFAKKVDERLVGLKRQRFVAVGVLVASLSLTLYLFMAFRRAALSAVGELVEGARRVAAGELDRPVSVDTRDEFAQVAACMNEAMATVNAMTAAQDKMARQHDAGFIDERIDANRFSGAYGRMVQSINELAAAHISVTMRVVEVVKRYALGDLSPDMDRLPGKKAQITEAMDGVKASLEAINVEIARLVDAAARGDFKSRGDAEKFQHEFRRMIDGLNTLMQTSDTGLSDVSRVLNAIARGVLTERITADYSGTFGQLKDDTNTTVERLREVVGRIKEASEAINTAAGEIASGNADLSGRTESQASSLEETASSMEQLYATVKQNAENARQANDLAKNSNEVAIRGGDMVNRVVATMGSIQESSKKIADIIGVIDSIAFQTNILALNAAVEAARAGDQGRGFAVVATEVRNLAQRSATAAKEIKTLIADSVDKVEDGARLVSDAGDTMGEVVTSFQKVAALVTGISEASREQSCGIEQVSQAVGQMDEATQQNAAMVEQAAAAAESLEDQARTLVQAVGMFRLVADSAVRSGEWAEEVAVRQGPLRARNVARMSTEPEAGIEHRETGTPPAMRRPARAAAALPATEEWEEF